LNYSQKAHNESGEKIAWKSPPREQSMSNDTQAAFQPLLDILYGSEGTHLLYSARLAHTAHTKRPYKHGKSSHTSTAAAEPTIAESTA
jgi:hypothetical protein